MRPLGTEFGRSLARRRRLNAPASKITNGTGGAVPPAPRFRTGGLKATLGRGDAALHAALPGRLLSSTTRRGEIALAHTDYNILLSAYSLCHPPGLRRVKRTR